MMVEPYLTTLQMKDREGASVERERERRENGTEELGKLLGTNEGYISEVIMPVNVHFNDYLLQNLSV